MEDFEQEEKEGMKVEVKRPHKKKAQPVSSGNKGKFSGNKGKAFEIDDVEDDNEIEEDIQTDRDKEFGLLGDNI